MGVDGSNLIVALDFSVAADAVNLARQLDPSTVRLKVGKQLFTAAGPDLVRSLQDLGFDIFLDLKFHDIPNTVAEAVHSAADLGVWMVNVHASGGSRMMRAAREALIDRAHKPLLVAVTVLTSMTREDLAELNWDADPLDRVYDLSTLAQQSGMDGVVCSAAEVSMLRRYHSQEFLMVTPGIRQAGDAVGDQRRVVTPLDAISAGATHLVVGRAITASLNPAETVLEILASISSPAPS